MSLDIAILMSQLSLQGAENSVERHESLSPAQTSEHFAISSSDVSLATGAEVVVHRGTSLHTLDEDLLLLILSLLDSEDLAACKQTCRFLSQIVAGDARLQYGLALGASGMVDGPASKITLGERIKRLDAYHARVTHTRKPDSCERHVWPRSELRVQMLVCDRTVFYAVAAGAGYKLDIRSPRAAPRQITIRLWSEYARFQAADLSQDLIIVGEIQIQIEGPTLKMHLLSIETGKPHPAAAAPYIDVECGRATEFPVQILREKVVWQRCQSDPHANCDVEVWNWQTCELVWRHAFRPQVSYLFLDDNHLIVTAYRQEEVMIYLICEDGTASVNGEAKPLLTLELPPGAFRCVVHYDDRSRIHRSSATVGLPFVPDPALAVTAIRFSIYAPERSTALLLVPGATFYDQLRVVDTKHGDRRRSRKVFWQDWAPKGALLLNMSSPLLVGRISFNTYGSRMALIIQKTSKLLYRRDVSWEVVILDISPRAARVVINSRLLQGRNPHRTISSTCDDVESLQFSKLHATTSHFVFSMGPGLRCPWKHYPTMISMDGDGFIVLHEWNPPYQEPRSGFGYQTFAY